MIMSNYCKILKENLKSLKDMFLSVLPHGKTEIILFISILLMYLSYSFIIVYYSDIIEWTKGYADLYLGFDTPQYFHMGFSHWTVHPLCYYITKPLTIIGYIIANIGGLKAKAFFSVIFTSGLVSLSCIYIHRYLKNIMDLRGVVIFLLPVFFCFFSTNLILAFSTESYTLSAFLLSFTVYYYSYQIKKNEDVLPLTGALLSVTLGGITITNFAKGIIPILFLKNKFLSRIILMSIYSVLFGICVLMVEYKYGIFKFIKNFVVKYSKEASDISFFDKVFDFFIGAPILFPTIIFDKSKKQEIYDIEGMIDITLYNHWWQIVFISFILVFMGLSILRNYKNKYVQMLALLLGFDVCLHIIMKFGINEGFIYGAHWIYTVPLFIGWLYKSMNNKLRRIMLPILSLMLLVLVVNNINQLITFIELAIQYFRIQADSGCLKV